MPVHADERVERFDNELKKLLMEAQNRQIPDAEIVSILKGWLEAYEESAQAVLDALKEDPDEEKKGGVAYIG